MRFTAIFLLLTVFTFSLSAQETKIMIRAKAKDAKFIGSSIGGAKIIVKEAVTGKILAEGITRGSTGNTKKIMQEDWKRGENHSENDTAGFMANLNIDEPVFVTVEAYAPYNKKQARVTSSTQFWAIPGKNVLGDGVVLEIPGFVVDVLSPQTHERISSDREITITANIVMTCGCPVADGGIWNSESYEIYAVVSSENGKSQEIDLKQTDKSSTFSATASLEKGLYEITVIAFDPGTGNSGLDKTNIIIN